MSEYRRLLLLAPPEMRRSPAFERAEALALAMGASLYIMAFDFVDTLEVAALFDPDAMARARDGYLELHRRWLRLEADRLRCQGVDVSSNILWCRHPRRQILEYIHDLKIDLLIKDVHLESGLKRLFVTPLDWQLLRDCPVPVHLVAAGLNPLPRHVVVAVDVRGDAAAETLNDTLVRTGQGMARQCGAILSLVHVHDKARSYVHEMGWGTLPMADGLEMASRADALQAFRELANRHSIEKNQRHFLSGTVLETINTFVSQSEGDVIVLGTRHAGVLEHILGSTAENILYRSASSILAVSPGYAG
ncbi:universal stress protein [Pseudomonas gingeri]|uniref:universal stress protein n=1 Tax=Pseudomonas gingeri TaxID=117681 RepID=UPI0015A41097|nr:universal stress protein [Pseudomonas gingeri]NVZ63956.1 universal stress protein [Pseudomonas gingeri]NVZ76320.1 universal stress protein [Pseudomonas gingeri]